MPFKSFTSSRLRRQRASAPRPTQAPETLPQNTRIDEETVPNYHADDFYPANPGEVLNKKFELLTKLGWGTSSTVWLARDMTWNRSSKAKKYVAIKICNRATEDEISHELDITIRLSSITSQHRGRGILGTAIESFGLESPTGFSHLALVFEPMREPLWLFRRRVMDCDKVTRPMLPLVKAYLRVLLEGLDFLHSEGHMIHTDLKLDNVMVTIEDQSVVEDFLKAQAEHPMAQKKVGGRTIYRCHNNFGDIDGKEALKKIYPKITDFGLARRVDTPGPHITPIQPNDCHAPEVLLGTGWSYSADIWNLGIMIWELLAGQSPFQRGDQSQYSPVTHLAEMIALLGPVPSVLIEREKDMRRWQWSPEIRNFRGDLCSNALGFYGGPFFTDDGQFTHNDAIPFARSLRHEVPDCIQAEEVDEFLRFMRRMLRWLPEERATARELRDDPWLA